MFLYLRNSSETRGFLSLSDSEYPMHAFKLSRRDYCNSLNRHVSLVLRNMFLFFLLGISYLGRPYQTSSQFANPADHPGHNAQVSILFASSTSAPFYSVQLSLVNYFYIVVLGINVM